MAILEIQANSIVPVPSTTLIDQKIRERADLQRLLRASIDVVADDIYILAEEFGNWEDSRRRIDLLGLDREGNLVVIEIKRTDDGGHMELQALRYAAMTSALTFDQAVDAHREYLAATGRHTDAREAILEFLQWEEPNEDTFAQDVRIVLVSKDFSREVTTTVLWLNQKGMDIRCIRLTPYKLGDRLLLDVQQIIPLPEAAEYQTRVRNKEQSKTAARTGRDLTRFTLELNGQFLRDLPKRHAVLQVFRYLAQAGVSPEAVASALGGRNPDRTIRRYAGTAVEADIVADLAGKDGGKGGPMHPRRWFHAAADLIQFDGDTYVVSNQWGRHAEPYLRSLASKYSKHKITIHTAAAQ